MKLLVETTGPFMLVDELQVIQAHRPSVIFSTVFFSDRVSRGQISVLAGDLNDEATDAEFAKYVAESKGDIPLAVASFLSAFLPEKVTKKEGKKTRNVSPGEE